MNDKWYFKPHILVLAFLCVGPFALPLVWFNPNLSKKNKRIISFIIVILSAALAVIFFLSLKSIYEYYNLLLQEIR